MSHGLHVRTIASKFFFFPMIKASALIDVPQLFDAAFANFLRRESVSRLVTFGILPASSL